MVSVDKEKSLKIEKRLQDKGEGVNEGGVAPQQTESDCNALQHNRIQIEKRWQRSSESVNEGGILVAAGSEGLIRLSHVNDGRVVCQVLKVCERVCVRK